MKICIIGGGWVGCHLAIKFRNDHDVSIYEKNVKLFEETSFNNQNRLHLGYHYARSYRTRKLCYDTFQKFLNEYGFLTKSIINNWYCVDNKKSIIDYRTYLQIFNDYQHDEVDNIFKNVEGIINTKEKQIDFKSAYNYFNNELNSIHIQKEILKKDLKALSKKYDMVIDCTNNHLEHKYKKNSFFETTVSYIYEKIKETPFDAITMVDGPFFSIYPYKNNLYTITDVEFTPLKTFKTSKPIKKYNEAISKTKFLLNNSKNIEKKILKYYPEFLESFRYNGYFLSTKSKTVNSSDDRYPIINKNKNIYYCFTGKIQGIFIIEDYIRNEINNW